MLSSATVQNKNCGNVLNFKDMFKLLNINKLVHIFLLFGKILTFTFPSAFVLMK